MNGQFILSCLVIRISGNPELAVEQVAGDRRRPTRPQLRFETQGGDTLAKARHFRDSNRITPSLGIRNQAPKTRRSLDARTMTPRHRSSVAAAMLP